MRTITGTPGHGTLPGTADDDTVMTNTPRSEFSQSGVDQAFYFNARRQVAQALKTAGMAQPPGAAPGHEELALRAKHLRAACVAAAASSTTADAAPPGPPDAAGAAGRP